MSKRKKDKKKKRRSVAGATAKRRERAESGFSDMFNLPKGTEMFGIKSTGVKRLDIIPYVVGEGNPNAEEDSYYWERTFFAHRGIGVNNEMVICPARTVKKKCPICEYQSKLQRDPEADEDTVKALSPSKRMLVNIAGVKKDSDKVKIWHISHWYFGKAIDEALAAAYEDHDDNMDNFCDPDGGHYLKCVAEAGYEGNGFNIARVDFIPRKEDLEDEVLESAACLDDILVVKEYDELKDMFYAAADDDDDDEDEPKKKKGKKKDKKKKKDEDEDEDDDGFDDDEDEDEEPKKKKKGKKKKKKDDDEDEDDDEDDAEGFDDDDDDDDNTSDGNDDDDNWEMEGDDDDDDDEDDEPKKKKKKKKKKKNRK